MLELIVTHSSIQSMLSDQCCVILGDFNLDIQAEPGLELRSMVPCFPSTASTFLFISHHKCADNILYFDTILCEAGKIGECTLTSKSISSQTQGNVLSDHNPIFAAFRIQYSK
jgi:hypothetical protein